MTRSIQVVALLGGLALVGWVVRPAVSAQRDQSPVPAAAGQWEYATLVQTETLAVFNRPGANADAVELFELFQAMGGKGKRDAFDVTDFLTLVGRDGWELVTVVEKADSPVYYFKRAKS